MGLGLEGAYGAAGGWDALHKIIAERKKDEILKYKQEEDRRQYELQLRQQQDSEKWRELQFEGLQQERQARNEDRDAVRAAAEKQALATAIKNKFGALSGGTNVGAQSFAEAQQAGIVEPGQFTPNPIDPNNPDAPQTFKYGGSAAWQQHQEDQQARLEAAKQAQADREQIVRLTASLRPPAGGDGGGRPYYNPIPDTAAPSGISAFNARTGKLEPVEPAGGQSHLVGPAAKEAISKVKGIDDALSNLDAVETIGNRHGWKGTGPLSGVRRVLSSSGLVADPEGDAVRAAAEYVGALTNHPLFGSAFTETEKGLMQNFATSASAVGTANLARIATMREILKKGRERRLQGIEVSGPNAGRAGGGTAPPAATPDQYGALDIFK